MLEFIQKYAFEIVTIASILATITPKPKRKGKWYVKIYYVLFSVIQLLAINIGQAKVKLPEDKGDRNGV